MENTSQPQYDHDQRGWCNILHVSIFLGHALKKCCIFCTLMLQICWVGGTRGKQVTTSDANKEKQRDPVTQWTCWAHLPVILSLQEAKFLFYPIARLSYSEFEWLARLVRALKRKGSSHISWKWCCSVLHVKYALHTRSTHVNTETTWLSVVLVTTPLPFLLIPLDTWETLGSLTRQPVSNYTHSHHWQFKPTRQRSPSYSRAPFYLLDADLRET